MSKRIQVAALAALASTALGAQTFADASALSNNDEVRSIVAEMLADAETRSSMLQSASAGHDGAFFLASPDGNFRLNVKGFMQFRYHLNFTSDDNTVGDDFQPGFSNPRTLLFFTGHIFDSALTYQIRMNFSRATGAAFLDDAFIAYKYDENWSDREMKAGPGIATTDAKVINSESSGRQPDLL